MASVLRMGVKSSAGILDRAFLSLSAGASLPHFSASVGVFSCSLEQQKQQVRVRGVSGPLASQASRAFSSRAPLGRTSPAPAPAASASARAAPAAPAAAGRRPDDAESDSESSSDSDEEFRRERGTSEFWRRKMMSFHSLIDLNNDGVVSYDDFTILADRFINLGHLSPTQQEDFREALKIVWEDQWGKVHPYNLVTTEQYIVNMHHTINDRQLSRKAHLFLPHLFEALDKDKDGIITVDEFKIFFKCLGRSEEDAIRSYTIIDNNHDGLLSLKEFVRLGREYFTVEEPTHPSTHFWGPLTTP